MVSILLFGIFEVDFCRLLHIYKINIFDTQALPFKQDTNAVNNCHMGMVGADT